MEKNPEVPTKLHPEKSSYQQAHNVYLSENNNNNLSKISLVLFAMPMQIWTNLTNQEYLFLLLVVLSILLFISLLKQNKKLRKTQNTRNTLKANVHYLRQQEEKQQNLIQTIPASILQTDFRGNIINIVQQGNPNYFDITESTDSLYTIFPGRIHKKLEKTLNKLKDKTSTSEVLHFSTDSDKEEAFYKCCFVKTENENLLCFLRNRSRFYKKINDLVQSRNQIQEKIKSKDQFLSILAHDLRGPFNSLLGFSNILNNEYENHSLKEKKQYITEIYKSSEQLFQLLNNLLDWTRLQNNKIKYSPFKQDLVNTIVTAVWEMEQYAQEKNIEIFRELPEEFIIEHDSTMLHSTIVNLLSNAIKYSHPGREVHLKATQPNPENIRIAVSDQGIGIDPEGLQNLFHIDGQYKKPGTQDEDGSGLGLILCQEFVHHHKGKIYVHSSPGKGSTFEVFIPVN